jgi:hypothetical protein
MQKESEELKIELANVLIYSPDKTFADELTVCLKELDSNVYFASTLEGAVACPDYVDAIIIDEAGNRAKQISTLRKKYRDACIFLACENPLHAADSLKIQAAQKCVRRDISHIVSNLAEHRYKKSTLRACAEEHLKNRKSKFRFVDSLITSVTESPQLARRMMRSVLETVRLAYEKNGKRSCRYAIRKRSRSHDQDTVPFETMLYHLLQTDLPDCLVRLKFMDVEDAAFLVEWWGKPDFSDFGRNTLEEVLENYSKELHCAENEDIKVQLRIARTRELENLARMLAKFHFNSMYALDHVLGPGRLKEYMMKGQHVIVYDNNENKWKLEYRTKNQFIDRFVHFFTTLLERRHLWSKDKPCLDSSQAVQKLEEIISKEPDLFSWYDCRPHVFLHGDLHARNIVYKNCRNKNTPRFIDLKNMKFGPLILDFGFLQNPVYDADQQVKTAVYKAYIDMIAELQEHRRFWPFYDDIRQRLDSSDLVRHCDLKQVYWNMRIAYKISHYVAKYSSYTSDIKKYLQYVVNALDVVYKRTGSEGLKNLAELYRENLL